MTALILTGRLSCLAQALERSAQVQLGGIEPVPSTGFEIAQRQVKSGDFAAAESTLKRYITDNESSAEAHALLGYAEMRLNKPRESLSEYTRGAQLKTPTAEDLRAVADDYALLDDFTDADHWMSRALQMSPRNAEIWYSLGRIRYSLQRFQEAATCFKKTLELMPESVKAANNLGLAYEGLNRTEDAMREYRLAITWQANSAHPSEQPLLNLAIMLVHQNKAEEALPLLMQAVAIAPGDAHIHDQLGHLYLNRGELPEAQQAFERAVALVPKSGAYHFLLGQVYRRRGMADEARLQFKLASDLDGSHSSPQ